MKVKKEKTILITLFNMVLTFVFLSLIFPPLLYAPKNTLRPQVLVDASSNNFPPMNFIDKDTNLKGFGKDLSDAVIKSIGLEVKHIHSSNWNEVLEWLASGKADFIHDAGYTETRDKFLDYTSPIIEMPEMIFVRPDQYDITGFNSLNGKKVACVNKHISHLYLQNFPDITCYIVKTPAEGLYELVTGNVDAFVYPKQITLYLAQNLRLTDKIKTTGNPLRVLTWSMVVKEGNKELLRLLNDGIEEVKKTGEYDRIYDKWWGKRVLTGYSKRELRIITAATVGAAIVIVSLIAFVIYSQILRSGKNKLKKEIFQRKQVETLLRESEERLLLAMDSVSDAVWDWNVQSNEIYFSPQWYRMLGYEPYELPQEFETWKGLLHPDDSTVSEKKILKSIVSGKPFKAEFRMQTKDGQWKWILCRGKTALMDDQGRPIRMLGTHLDLDDRKQTETALQESEEKYRTFFQNSCDAMLMLQDGIYTDCNDAALKALGFQEAGEIINRPPSIVSPEYQPDGKKSTDKAEEMIETAYEQGSHRFEWEHKRKNGDLFPVEVSLTAMPSEGKMALLVVWRDISDRKKAEAQSERLMLAIEHVAESIIITDTNATIQYVNPAFEQITGYLRKEVLGKNPNVLKSGEQKKSFYQNLWNTLQHPATWYGRLINKKKDGALYVEEATISPVLNASGKVVNYVAVKRDITDEIQIETRLQQAQKTEAIGSLAGGIAHDFNNILFPIVGMAEMLTEDLPENSPEQLYAKEIFQAGQRAGDLVKQILSFSRQTEFKAIPIKIQTVLKEVLKLCRSTIPSDIEITKDIQHDCSLVKADPTQIHQVAMNLITNAYHAVEEKSGKITVHLKEFELGKNNLQLSSLKPGLYAKLTVSDTGSGIDSNIMDKIFNPYFTTKDQGKGTGLGLATVYRIVRDYHGDIKVYSEIGVGSTFDVYLPIIEVADKTQLAVETKMLQTGNERILLVDDEEPIVELEKIILERLGYQVAPFTSSIEALKSFHSDPKAYDLVITDMTMPQMTGDMLSKELREIRPDIPILICTGFSERMEKEQTETIGANGFLMKPVVRTELSKKIREILDRTVNSSL